MGRKSAAQRLAALEAYSSDVPPNPLVLMREERNVSQREMAEWLGVQRGIVNSAEDATFSMIPTSYRAHIVRILEVGEQYQEHRKQKRLYYWDPVDFPEHPARTKPLTALVEHFEMNLYAFAAKSCVHQSELWKMNTRRFMGVNFEDFLDTIGIDKVWKQEFNDALSRSGVSRVRIPRPA